MSPEQLSLPTGSDELYQSPVEGAALITTPSPPVFDPDETGLAPCDDCLAVPGGETRTLYHRTENGRAVLRCRRCDAARAA